MAIVCNWDNWIDLGIDFRCNIHGSHLTQMNLKVQLRLEVDVNILVCGFMGSGKTTFVESFAQNNLGYLTYDLDVEVAQELGISPMSLGEWINKFGLEEFRKKEIKVLSSLIRQKTAKVIALGGGTVEAAGFWELRQFAKIVFLKTSFETCFLRIKNDSNRPLTSVGEAGLKDLYNKRLSLYQKADLELSEAQIKEIVGLGSLVHNLGSK